MILVLVRDEPIPPEVVADGATVIPLYGPEPLDIDALIDEIFEADLVVVW